MNTPRLHVFSWRIPRRSGLGLETRSPNPGVIFPYPHLAKPIGSKKKRREAAYLSVHFITRYPSHYPQFVTSRHYLNHDLYKTFCVPIPLLQPCISPPHACYGCNAISIICHRVYVIRIPFSFPPDPLVRLTCENVNEIALAPTRFLMNPPVRCAV